MRCSIIEQFDWKFKKKVYILNAKHGVSFKVLVFILMWRQYYIFDDTEFLTTFLSIKKAQENNYRKNPVNQSKKIGLLIMVIFGSTLTVRLCGVNPSMKKNHDWANSRATYMKRSQCPKTIHILAFSSPQTWRKNKQTKYRRCFLRPKSMISFTLFLGQWFKYFL